MDKYGLIAIFKCFGMFSNKILLAIVYFFLLNVGILVHHDQINA